MICISWISSASLAGSSSGTESSLSSTALAHDQAGRRQKARFLDGIDSEARHTAHTPRFGRRTGAGCGHRDHEFPRVSDRGRSAADRPGLTKLAIRGGARGAIRVKPDAEENGGSLVAKAVSVSERAPGVEGVHAYSAAESATLLQPWLGEGIDLSLLPIPRIIVVHMQKRSADDLGALREALARAVPQANLDDHRRWAARLGTMANAIVGLAAAVFALMMAAMSTAIGFATRGAMAENREIVEVLHLVGASDAFIAREFQTHFRRLGFRGALIGGASAMAFF